MVENVTSSFFNQHKFCYNLVSPAESMSALGTYHFDIVSKCVLRNSSDEAPIAQMVEH